MVEQILSVKAVASILSWTMQLGKDLCINSSFTSLWDFCCKVILFRTIVSEVRNFSFVDRVRCKDHYLYWIIYASIFSCCDLPVQTGSEIHLAAYESLGSVLKALSTHFSPSALEFVMVVNRSIFRVEQNEFLLDPFLRNFLQSINDLLDKGTLTRSRRSILMKWKVAVLFSCGD